MAELIPGIAYDFGGGRVYTIPPLSLGALQRLQGAVEALNADTALAPAAIATVVQAAHAALKRNYPALTEDDVADLIDVANMYEVLACVLDVAGVKRKAGDAAKNMTAQPTPAAETSGQP